MGWYFKVLKKFTEFNGRSGRKEFWIFTIINVLISFILLLVDVLLGTFNSATGVGILGGLYGLGVFIPALAVTVRRLHDTGKSGWFFFVVLIPVAGAIWLLILMAKEGDSGENRFGPDPKENLRA